MYFITIKRMLEVCFSAHPNIQYRARLFMEIRQGYSYHIKDEFFDLVQGDSG